MNNVEDDNKSWDDSSSVPSLVSSDPNLSLSYSIGSVSENQSQKPKDSSKESQKSVPIEEIKFEIDPSKLENKRSRNKSLSRCDSWYDPIFNFIDNICSIKEHTRETQIQTRKKYKHRIQFSREQNHRFQQLSQQLMHLNDTDNNNHHYVDLPSLKRKSQGRQSVKKSSKVLSSLPGSKSMDEECMVGTRKPKEKFVHKPAIFDKLNCVKMETAILEDLDEVSNETDDICYDSDPGEFSYRRGSMRKSDPRDNLSFSIIEDDIIGTPRKKDGKQHSAPRKYFSEEISSLSDSCARQIVRVSSYFLLVYVC